MYRVSISIITLVAMWATIILQCHTIHIINKRKVPDEPFDKDINVRSKDEPQTEVNCDRCKHKGVYSYCHYCDGSGESFEPWTDYEKSLDKRPHDPHKDWYADEQSGKE